MKRIKDPVHGYIPIEDRYIENIVDNRFFQRLRHVRQLTSTYLVYPAANHSRFEHSIGVFYLASQALDNLKEDDNFCNVDDMGDIERTVLSTALLHDVGHPPLSHIGEDLLKRDHLREILSDHGFEEELAKAETLGQDILEKENKHELLSCVIILEKFSEGLDELGVDPAEVCSHIFGLSIKGEVEDTWQRKVGAELISSPMDVDRLDYIARDDYITGADVANVDTDRMVKSYTTSDSSLVLSDKALSAIRNYLEGRLSLYMWVHQHHKVVYSDELLKEAVKSLVDEGDRELISAELILEDCINDNYIMDQLRGWSKDNPESRRSRLFDRFRSRDFLSSCWKHRLEYEEILGDSWPDFDESVDSNQEGVAQYIRDGLGLERDELWIATSNVPEYKPSELRRVHIKQGDDDKKSVDELGIYSQPDFIKETPYVYTTPENKQDVIKFIKDI